MRKKQKLVSKGEVQECLRHYKEILRLSDWDYAIVMRRDASEEYASVSVDTRRKFFTLNFFPKRFAIDSSEDRTVTLRSAILHELLHVLFAPVYYAAAIESECDLDNFKTITEHIEEPIIDSLARTLARYLPRPR